MSKEKLIAEIDKILSEALSTMKKSQEAKTPEKEIEEVIEKSLDEVSDAKAASTDVQLEANGGGDVIKNKEERAADVENVEKAKDSDDDKDDEDKKKEKKEDVKKSFEVTAEQYERLQKALKEDEDKAKEEASKSDPLYKSVEGMANLIKSLTEQVGTLTEKVQTMGKAPAREPKSLNGYQAIEKSNNGSAKAEKKLKKSQVLDVMFDLQKAGKVQDVHICEYEASGNILDKHVQSIVQAELDKING